MSTIRWTLIGIFFVGLAAAGCGTSQQQDASEERARSFSLEEDDGRLIILEGRDSVLAYTFEEQLPEGVSERYRRSSYIHPVWDLEGTVITDDFPEDHYHHRGISWMWPRVIVGGERYDLWHLQGVEQRFEEWLTREARPEGAVLGVRSGWYAGEEKVLEERVRIEVHPAAQQRRTVDVRLTLEAVEPLELFGQEDQNKGYGGFSVRFGPREATVITSPEGREAEDSDHKRLAWADESGRFRGAGQASGIAVFQHPDNPGYPAEWTLRHYGFLGVDWPGNDGTRLQPGEPVTLRYRLWIHQGSVDTARVAAAYERYRQSE